MSDPRPTPTTVVIQRALAAVREQSARRHLQRPNLIATPNPPVEHSQMATLSAVAERIKQKQAAHQAKADQISKRLDALDQAEPAAFASLEYSIGSMEVDLSSMESEVRALSNGAPLAPPAGAQLSPATPAATSSEK